MPITPGEKIILLYTLYLPLYLITLEDKLYEAKNKIRNKKQIEEEYDEIINIIKKYGLKNSLVLFRPVIISNNPEIKLVLEISEMLELRPVFAEYSVLPYFGSNHEDVKKRGILLVDEKIVYYIIKVNSGDRYVEAKVLTIDSEGDRIEYNFSDFKKMCKNLFEEVNNVEISKLFNEITTIYIEKGKFPSKLFLYNYELKKEEVLLFDKNCKCYLNKNKKISYKDIIEYLKEGLARPSAEFYYPYIISNFSFTNSFIFDNFDDIDPKSNLGKTLSELSERIKNIKPFVVQEINNFPKLSSQNFPREGIKVLNNLSKNIFQYSIKFENINIEIHENYSLEEIQKKIANEIAQKISKKIHENIEKFQKILREVSQINYDRDNKRV